MSGLVSYLSGRAAEDAIATDYDRRGQPVEARRWRGKYGEVDLIARDGETVVFVEVKKSRDFLRAAQRITPAQLERIHATACEYLENEPKGQMTPCRFDMALVNAQGATEIIENALAY
ncbi:YraN family protein [Aliiroseovarius sp. F47248L]|uniref:YraN family protein n=1 Tax=Aliiroseovarius sp. F47248L TaxID=2926420 RepID=UPI001FF55D04|nr:YraN family protein [Aliiroseovarius sp. F47248L]MCK0137666.1 YraN family protein [Aliiroseovarius sp. F47248L]